MQVHPAIISSPPRAPHVRLSWTWTTTGLPRFNLSASFACVVACVRRGLLPVCANSREWVQPKKRQLRGPARQPAKQPAEQPAKQSAKATSKKARHKFLAHLQLGMCAVYLCIFQDDVQLPCFSMRDPYASLLLRGQAYDVRSKRFKEHDPMKAMKESHL